MTAVSPFPATSSHSAGSNHHGNRLSKYSQNHSNYPAGGDILFMCASLYRWTFATNSELSVYRPSSMAGTHRCHYAFNTIYIHPIGGNRRDIRPSVTHNLHAISTYVRVIPT